jgi:hypothetical protein
MKQLFDQVDVGENHPTTAISLQVKFIECITFAHILRQKFQVSIPFVANHLTTRETANWNDHIDSDKRLEPPVNDALYVVE